MPLMTLKNLQRELSRAQRRAGTLEAQLKAKMKDQYHALPARVGLKSIDHLIDALTPYASSKYQNGNSSSSSVSREHSVARNLGGTSREVSTRIRYGADVKAAIKRELQQGGKTFGQLSKAYGPSVYSIKDWKKSWGLTKTRMKKKKAA